MTFNTKQIIAGAVVAEAVAGLRLQATADPMLAEEHGEQQFDAVLMQNKDKRIHPRHGARLEHVTIQKEEQKKQTESIDEVVTRYHKEVETAVQGLRLKAASNKIRAKMDAKRKEKEDQNRKKQEVKATESQPVKATESQQIPDTLDELAKLVNTITDPTKKAALIQQILNKFKEETKKNIEEVVPVKNSTLAVEKGKKLQMGHRGSDQFPKTLHNDIKTYFGDAKKQ